MEMDSKEFNLLTEPWIKVLTPSLDIREVSLTEALVHAHHYKALAGEMPTQDFAMLRFLLACMQTIFYRYDEDGEFCPFEENDDPRDVLARWEAYWDAGAFPETAIRSYLETYTERFWLFHPVTPFYQVAGLAYGTDYSAPCLYGNLRSSNNSETKHHFSLKDGDDLESLSYGEAARWLLHLNGYCFGVKNKEAPGTKNPTKVGRLGLLGSLFADGDTLFALIMLNLTPLVSEDEIWGSPKPIWEQPVHTGQSIEVTPPDNLPELYTLQSRRILLKKEEDRVTSFRALNGDYYPTTDDFTEQLTLWRRVEDKKTHVVTHEPKLHNASVQAWREFPTIFNSGNMSHTPGIISWMQTLTDNDILDLTNEMITFRTVGLIYRGTSCPFYGDCVSDGISLSADLLGSFHESWRVRIADEIEKCRRLEKEALKPFVKKICTVLNEPDAAKEKGEQLAGKFYAEIDQPFRAWLFSIHPEKDKKEETVQRWEEIASRCAKKTAKEYIDTLENDFYRSRKTKSGEILSIPGAYNEYLGRTERIYPSVKEEA